MLLTWTFSCGGEVGVRLAARIIAFRSFAVRCRHALAEAVNVRERKVTSATHNVPPLERVETESRHGIWRAFQVEGVEPTAAELPPSLVLAWASSRCGKRML